MRKLISIFTILLTFGLYSPASAQTIINDYAAVLGYNPCGNKLDLDIATNFNVGDTILIIQMKGASVDSTITTAAFGDILAMNGAGNYEFNTIKTKTLNTINLTYDLKRAYNFVEGRVQVVRVPYYQDYTVSVPHTCMPWNGSKGGVFVVNVANTFTLNESIDVSGRGFKGGQITADNVATCDYLDYAFVAGSNFGGYKGEGIAELDQFKALGRGELANGGGGGNSTNAGGAGGGNAGLGGQGGRQWEQCDVFLNTGGVSGAALPYTATDNKIFLGGGGGAGHENDGDTDPAGNGGGIIIINANNFDGLDGFDTLKANGETVIDQNSLNFTSGDGQSGGGAGGVIFLKVNNYINTPVLHAKGGNGGNIYAPELYGPGGGGSGGAVLFNGSSVPGANIDVNGGINGTNTPTLNDHFAQPGQPGAIVNNFPFLLPVDSFRGFSYSVKDTFLSCREVLFTAMDNGGLKGNGFFWDFGDGTTGTGNPITHTFTKLDTYKVVLIVPDTATGCGDTVNYSVYVDIVTADFAVNDDTICQGATVVFTNGSSPNSVFSAWNFDDGTVDSTKDITHAFVNARNYNVSLIVGNGRTDGRQCLDTMYKTIIVDSISTITISTTTSILCEGEAIQFEADYIRETSRSITWDLGDGYISNINPVLHAYDTAGIYPVTATATFRRCPDATITEGVTINPYPTLDLGPDTSICPNGQAVLVSDKVNGVLPEATWMWNTGENSSSILVRHPGIFTAYVDLNGCVTSDSIEVFKNCYIDVPNAFTPNADGSNDYFLPRQLMSNGVSKFKMNIFSRWGQLIFETNNIDGRGWDGRFNGVDQPTGVYIYKVEAVFQNGAVENYTGNLTLLR